MKSNTRQIIGFVLLMFLLVRMFMSRLFSLVLMPAYACAYALVKNSLKVLRTHRREHNTNSIKPLHVSSSVSTRFCSMEPGIKESKSFGTTSKFIPY